MVGRIGGGIAERGDMQYGETRIDFLNRVLHETVDSGPNKAAGGVIGLGSQELVDCILRIGNLGQSAAKYPFPFHP